MDCSCLCSAALDCIALCKLMCPWKKAGRGTMFDEASVVSWLEEGDHLHNILQVYLLLQAQYTHVQNSLVLPDTT